MKRALLVAFCVIALCNLCLIVNIGTVKAYKEGYQVDDFTAVGAVTLDGKWTTPEEWVDSPVAAITPNAIFRLKYTTIFTETEFHVYQYFMIEFFSDNTNDTLDYWQLNYAWSTDFGTSPPANSSTPNAGCLRMDYVGHTRAGFTLYKGTDPAPGTWSNSTDYTWGTSVFVNETVNASPLSGTPHWIVEIQLDHIYYGIWPEFWIRVAAYDASNSAAGVQSWPPGSSPDVPSGWGLMNNPGTTYPETLSFGVMVLLSSVSVLVGPRYFRKRSRIDSRGSGNP